MTSLISSQVAAAATLVLLLWLGLAAADDSFEISYVIEPFEAENITQGEGWFVTPSDAWSLTVDNDQEEALFGNASLRVDFEPLTSSAEAAATLSFGWTASWDQPPHNCHGARYLSFWYKLLPNNSTSAVDEIRLSLLEDSNETFYHDTIPDNSNHQWQELQIDLSHDLISNSTNDLDTRRLRGWQVQLELASSDAASGTILFDQLACVGGGDMLGDAFGLGDWDQAVQQGIWMEDFYQSNISATSSQIEFQGSDTLYVNYTIEQTEAWGGYMSMEFLAPGSAYYNLSAATDLSFGYSVHQASSSTGRAHFRLILTESSDSCLDCNDYERWYSFNYILDEASGSQAEMVLPLEGSVDTGMAFWLPGWSGGLGNRQFDKEYIKGFILEYSMDSQGDTGSLVQGAMDLHGVKAKSRDADSMEEEEDESYELTYVMEPFEWIDEDWFLQDSTNTNLNLTLTDGLFGNFSLSVGYEFGDFTTTQFGFVMDNVPHNCHGATHMSIWYRMLDPLPELHTEIRLKLLDDDGDLAKADMEQFTAVFPEMDDNEWHEFRIPMEELQIEEDVGGNGQLDLTRLRGWSIELAASATSGVLIVDQLACVGGHELIGSSFFSPLVSFDEAVEEDIWYLDFYQSELSENETNIDLEGGIFNVDYTVQQVEAWGGFLAFGSHAAGPAYYNLSQANYLNLRYHIRQPASIPGRLHLRLILIERSDVCFNCSDWERWYNFNYVLDNNQTNGDIQAPLEGSTDPSSPFWLPGWAGGLGNEEFDKDYIKGVVFEFSIDSQGDIGSTVSGAIDLYDLSASKTKESLPEVDTLLSADTLVEEPDLWFDTGSPRFRSREFLGNQCTETCSSDPACLYAVSTGLHCFVASSLEPGDVTLANTVALRRDAAAFWLDGSRRGNFCDLCACREDDQTIDCSNRGLKTVPKTFELPWTPRVLDLQNNTNLLVLGAGALDEIAETLEELRLPRNMAYVAPEINQLPRLAILQWDEEAKANSNAITESTEAFSDVCCSRGSQVNLAYPPEGMTFCQMDVQRPGSDSTFVPFLNYYDGPTISVIRPSSDFMSEAAESVELCAEYCAISSECRFFSYDARVQNAEHLCYLRTDNGTQHVEVCCEDDHYANPERTLPGWTSGLPPRTRHEIDNARVLIAPQVLVADESNGYETFYDVHLGSMPLRGAVWVEPGITAGSTSLQVSFQPSRVVLYDSNSTAMVKVRVSVGEVEPGRSLPTLVVHNKITSCDVAFMEASDAIISDRETTVFIDVILPEVESESNTMVIVVIAVALTVVSALALFIYFDQRRRATDAMWKVKKEELIFGDPPEIVGRGSYGLVLKAEYRGTAVAVKRVIPPRNKNKGSTTLSDSTGRIFNIGQMSGDDKSGASSRSKSKGTSSISMPLGSQSLYSEKRNWSIAPMSSDRAVWIKRRDDFVREMTHLSKLRHPCITTVMGAVIGGKSEPMLVMELMEHGSLYDLLHNETMILEAEITLPLLRDVSQGMRFLHSSNPCVVHGDLKSQNILVDRNFSAKVADFGLSQRKTKIATGTPLWMAPELLRGESCNTTASDVYSFGIILTEMYSRKDPYYGEEVEDVLRLVADTTVNKRPDVPRDMPASVQAFMTDCLVSDPEQRPTFTELDQRLQRVDEKNLETANNLRSSRKRNNISLFDIFPKAIAEALRDGRKPEPEHRDVVTIFFSDIVGFTNISSSLEPQKIASMLDRLYTQFDALSNKHDIYKVETIGDAYMAVSNLVKDQPKDHVKRITEFAIEAIEAANTVQIDPDDPEKGCVSIRVGFHSGPVVADVVGTRNPRFCLFGDTVNTASRMESNGEKGRIHCSTESATLLETQFPEMRLCSRGGIHVKGKGIMETYWVNEVGRRPSEKVDALRSSVHSVNYYAKSLRFSTEMMIREESESKSAFDESANSLSMVEAGRSPAIVDPITSGDSAVTQLTEATRPSAVDV